MFDCGTPHPRLLRVLDPFGKLVVKAKGSVRIAGAAIVAAVEGDRAMSTADATELTDIVNRVRTWSPESRIVLARRILETLETAQPPTRVLPARSVQELIGIGAGDSPPPDDEAVGRWIDEHRVEKYG